MFLLWSGVTLYVTGGSMIYELVIFIENISS